MKITDSLTQIDISFSFCIGFVDLQFITFYRALLSQDVVSIVCAQSFIEIIYLNNKCNTCIC